MLTGGDAGHPSGFAAFHDIQVWIRRGLIWIRVFFGA